VKQLCGQSDSSLRAANGGEAKGGSCEPCEIIANGVKQRWAQNDVDTGRAKHEAGRFD